MSTEYTIVFIYTGQNNTSATRSLSFGSFSAIGDIDRNIGQIKSITYVHYHTATKSMNWGLRGRLVLNDGTTFVSDEVYGHISGDIVKFVNTFTTLPTAEQLHQLAYVQTLDTQGKTTAGGYSSTLYWRATSEYPMQLIVTFVEEPPVTYAPSVETFSLVRRNESDVADDEGEYIATNLKLNIGDAAGLEGAELRIYYASNAYPVVGESEYVDLTSRISELISGVTLDKDILSGKWDIGYSWYFAAVFVTGDESAIATATASRGKCSFHISDYRSGGACVCGFSTGTTDKPKFESHAPGYFYAGIPGVTSYSTEETSTGGKWIDGKTIYRIVIPFTIAAGMVVIGSVTDAETIVRIEGVFSWDGGYWVPATHYFDSGNLNQIFVTDDMSVNARCSFATSGFAYIEYTKSTD